MAKIGIFDSGLGGLSVLRAIAALLPDEEYVYFADSAHCPYGDKSKDYIIDRCREITEILIKEGAEIIVVACNTATTAAIKVLRSTYNIKFIGMEPAIKPACAKTRNGIIGVLATTGTIASEKYRITKNTFGGKCKVLEHVGSGFVELVEACRLKGEETERVVRNSLKPLLEQGADTIVLGCTHYPFLLDTMNRIAGPDIIFIDPAPAIAKHLIEVMNEEGISYNKNKGPYKRPLVKLISSGENSSLVHLFDSIYPTR